MTSIAQSNSLADLAARIQREHEAVGNALKRGAEHAMAAGDLLLEAKAQLDHGQWGTWLRDHCQLSERSSQRYMRLARNRTELESNTTCVSDLSINSALAMLVSPADPDSLAANALAQAGGVLSKAEEILGINHCGCECRRRKVFIDEAAAAFYKVNAILEDQPSLASTIEHSRTLFEDLSHTYCIHVLCERHERAFELAEQLRDASVDCLRQIEAASVAV